MNRPAAQAGFFFIVRSSGTITRFVRRQVLYVNRRAQGSADANPFVMRRACG